MRKPAAETTSSGEPVHEVRLPEAIDERAPGAGVADRVGAVEAILATPRGGM